jgi:hypothetical protein
MKTYAHWLFGLAAGVNLSVVGWMLLGRESFVGILALDPVTGSNVVVFYLCAVLIGIFGYGYVRIAIDPVGFRPLIQIGAVGKVAAVATLFVGALLVPHVWRFFGLISGDLVFAGLFLDYLRRT